MSTGHSQSWRDTVLDGHAIFLFVCLVDGWMEAVQIKAGGGAGEGAALRDGWDGWLVAWWVCWFGRVFAWLVGRLVGCMDGWMLCKWRARRLHRPRTGFLVSTALGENTELWFGCLVGWFVGLAALLLGWLVGWLALRDGCMDGWMLCKWGGRGASPAPARDF